MDNTLTFKNQCVKSNAVHHKPYSFLRTFDQDHCLANFSCFLEESIPLRVYIAGYFHSKSCPDEVALAACENETTGTFLRNNVIFSDLCLKGSPVYENSRSTKFLPKLHLSPKSSKRYLIRVEYGQDKWTLFKTHEEIFHLYQTTKKCLHANPPKDFRSICYEENPELPPLPKEVDSREYGRHFKTRKKTLCQFFNFVCENLFIRNVSELLQFLEISHLSFVRELGCKKKEGLVMMQQSKAILPINKRRWLVVKDSFVCYLTQKNRIGGVFLMDKNFKCGTITHLFRKNCFVISNNALCYRVQCFSEFDRVHFLHNISSALKSTARPFVIPTPNGSFAPARFDVHVQWFIDNLVFFEALSNAICFARDEIFIAGWFVAPMISLKPNNKDSSKWCLDVLLKWKADEGVRVYILLSREFEFSNLVQKIFEDFENIMILSHPPNRDVSDGSVHHERLVIVDQSIVFFGGMDSSIYFEDSLGSSNHSFNASMSDGLKDETDNTEIFSFTTEMSGIPDEMCDTSVENSTLTPTLLIKSFTADTMSALFTSSLHDVTCCAFGACARDVARHFIQRWNVTHLTLRKRRRHQLPLLLPRSYEEADQLRVPNAFDCSAQVLRSACDWSAGIGITENSIQAAILSCINAAQHFIYIENQFFNLGIQDSQSVENDVARALVDKIVVMHSQNRSFRIFVVLPLVPATDSQVMSGVSAGELMRYILFRQQLFLSRKAKSFIRELEEALGGADIGEFISFCGLRTFCPESMTTHQVQVHSKLWIFDDNEVIMGSANFSDHSLVGYRDSEIGLHVKDTVLRPSCIRRKLFKADKFAWSLRTTLMAKHLGLDKDRDAQVLEDPVSCEFYENVWKKTAKKNTWIFEKVFKCCPTNSVRTFEQLDKYFESQDKSSSSMMKASAHLENIRGCLVEFPIYFLCEEDLKPSSALLKALPRRLSTV